MKKSVVKFFNQPAKVIGISAVLALAIGTYSYIHSKNALAEAFEKYGVKDIPSNTVSQTSGSVTLGFLSGGRIASVSVKTGDTVSAGQELATLDAGNARGALTQAEAVYQAAQANYQKILNGATTPQLDVMRSAVASSEVALSESTKQQDTLVVNARRNFLNADLTPVLVSGVSASAPIISGTYSGTDEGSYVVTTYATTSGGYFSYSGLENGTADMNYTRAVPLGTKGLFIQFSNTGNANSLGTTWSVNLPNKESVKYLSALNAYNSAVQTREQVIAQATAALDQAKAALVSGQAPARGEDLSAASAQVQNALGALQIAKSNYANTVIAAPFAGTVGAVSISEGQIAVPNAPAIEIYTSNN